MSYRTAQVKLLSSQFYLDYPHHIYPEILQKTGRGYGIFYAVIQIGHVSYDFAIPLHSNIYADKGFILNTLHSSDGGVIHSGLDYNKAVIVQPKHIGRTFIIKDRTEFNKINANQSIILAEFLKFVQNYIAAVQKHDNHILQSKYRFTTLQYFHTELGI